MSDQTIASGHVADDLPALLQGDADRTTVSAAAAHLPHCEPCRDDLVSALVAHSSLASAARLLPGLTASAKPAREPAPAEPLPELTQLFDQVRTESEAEAAPRRRRRVSTRWLAAAVIVGAAAGVGGAALANYASHSHGSARTIVLGPFEHGSVDVTAKMSGNNVSMDASALPDPGAGKLYEVWLTNTSRTQLHPVGWIGPDGKGSFTVPEDLQQKYSAVEVSVQGINAPYQYSGDSVARGTY